MSGGEEEKFYTAQIRRRQINPDRRFKKEIFSSSSVTGLSIYFQFRINIIHFLI